MCHSEPMQSIQKKRGVNGGNKSKPFYLNDLVGFRAVLYIGIWALKETGRITLRFAQTLSSLASVTVILL